MQYDLYMHPHVYIITSCILCNLDHIRNIYIYAWTTLFFLQYYSACIFLHCYKIGIRACYIAGPKLRHFECLNLPTLIVKFCRMSVYSILPDLQMPVPIFEKNIQQFSDWDWLGSMLMIYFHIYVHLAEQGSWTILPKKEK